MGTGLLVTTSQDVARGHITPATSRDTVANSMENFAIQINAHWQIRIARRSPLNERARHSDRSVWRHVPSASHRDRRAPRGIT